MSDKVLIKKETMANIANAIREKNGGSDSYTPSEMAGAVASIGSGLSMEEAEYLLDTSKKLPSEYHFKYSKSLGIPFESKLLPQEFDYTFDAQYIKGSRVFSNFGKFLTCTSGSSEKRILRFNKLSSISGSGYTFYTTKLTHIYFYALQSYSENNIFENNSYLRYLDLRSLNNLVYTRSSFNSCGDSEKGLTIYCENCGSIDGNVFYKCKLNELVLNNNNLVVLKNTNAFSESWVESETNKGFIYVKSELLDEYKNSTNWTTYADKIKPISEWGGIPE